MGRLRHWTGSAIARSPMTNRPLNHPIISPNLQSWHWQPPYPGCCHHPGCGANTYAGTISCRRSTSGYRLTTSAAKTTDRSTRRRGEASAAPRPGQFPDGTDCGKPALGIVRARRGAGHAGEHRAGDAGVCRARLRPDHRRRLRAGADHGGGREGLSEHSFRSSTASASCPTSRRSSSRSTRVRIWSAFWPPRQAEPSTLDFWAAWTSG